MPLDAIIAMSDSPLLSSKKKKKVDKVEILEEGNNKSSQASIMVSPATNILDMPKNTDRRSQDTMDFPTDLSSVPKDIIYVKENTLNTGTNSSVEKGATPMNIDEQDYYQPRVSHSQMRARLTNSN